MTEREAAMYAADTYTDDYTWCRYLSPDKDELCDKRGKEFVGGLAFCKRHAEMVRKMAKEGK